MTMNSRDKYPISEFLENKILSSNPSTAKWHIVDFLENRQLESSDFRLFVKEASDIGLTKTQYASLLHISPRTLSRNLNHKFNLDLDKAEKIIQLSRLFKRGFQTFGDKKKFGMWLQTYNIPIQKKPIEYLVAIAGIDLVEDTLGRIEHGIASRSICVNLPVKAEKTQQ